jgi:hypothetical protein
METEYFFCAHICKRSTFEPAICTAHPSRRLGLPYLFHMAQAINSGHRVARVHITKICSIKLTNLYIYVASIWDNAAQKFVCRVVNIQCVLFVRLTFLQSIHHSRKNEEKCLIIATGFPPRARNSKDSNDSLLKYKGNPSSIALQQNNNEAPVKPEKECRVLEPRVLLHDGRCCPGAVGKKNG